MKVMAVIPCWNEKRTIADVVTRTRSYITDAIVVDNLSTDATAPIARQAGARVVPCPIPGVGAATRVGVREAESLGAEVVVTLDGDGQHDPDDIPGLLDKLAEGYDVVVGSRSIDRRDMPFLRWLGNSMFDTMRNVGHHTKLTDAMCGFRAFRLESAAILLGDIPHFGFLEAGVIRARAEGYKIGSAPIRTIYGQDLYKYTAWQQLRRGYEIPLTLLGARWRYDWRPHIVPERRPRNIWGH